MECRCKYCNKRNQWNRRPSDDEIRLFEDQEKIKIYNIIVCEKLGIDKDFLPDLGSNRHIGYYFSKAKAFDIVKRNEFRIDEGHYHYAIIGEVREGLYQGTTYNHRWFFKFNSATNMYEEIPEPAEYRKCCGFTIG